MDTISYDAAGFFGFPAVAFHRHLGLEFERRDGEVVVALPPAPELLDGAGEQALAAAYVVAEVAAALTACDTLAAIAPDFDPDLKPVVLARSGRFRERAAAHGRLESRTRFAADPQATIERLAARSKAMVPIEVRILDGDGAEVADGRIDFYVRMMTESRLRAMTAAVEHETGGAR